MKSIFVVVVSVLLVIAVGCGDLNVKTIADSSLNVVKKSLKDSLYEMYFREGSYMSVEVFNCVRKAGENKIPVTLVWGKSNGEEDTVELKFNNGYYFDTIEAGIIHKYQLNKTIAWINSASLFALVPSGDSVKLSGEGYFETTDKPLTIFVEDTIKFVVSPHSHLNITAYKIPLDDLYSTKLAGTVLLKGQLIVHNGTSVDTIKAPKNYVFTSTKPNNWVAKTWNADDAVCWTKLKFDYRGIDLNELVERLGRRYNMSVETLKNSYLPINIKANFDERLEDLVQRLDTLNSYAHCRILEGKIVLSRK